MEVNLLIAAFGAAVSGFSAYLGVKVGYAEMRRDIRHLQEDAVEDRKRIERLEMPYFQPRVQG